MIKQIMLITGLKIEEWKDLFRKYPGAESISTSTISCWRQGKQQMRPFYRRIFINILCSQKELRAFEIIIRKRMMEYLNIRQYQKLYWDISDMEYQDFLQYILLDLNPDSICSFEYSWNKISLPVLVELCVQKADALASRLQFKVQDEGERLLLTYVHEDIEKYAVHAGFLFGDCENKELEQTAKCLSLDYENSLIRYLFVTQEISDELYIMMMEKYRVFLIKIDFYDIDAVKVIEAYIVENHFGLDEETLRFMNVLADVILHKICGMNLVVLKEILCRNFDINKISEQFWSSNSGVWKYQYPVRRALAFEEKFIKQKIRMAARQGQKKLEILDINLAGGLLGVRCSFDTGNVTCVDISPGTVQVKRSIIDRYNEVKNAANEGIYNVHCSYLRMDTMKIVGEKIPEDGYDMIIIGLGGASYIPDLDGFLRQLNGWLKKGKRDKEEAGVMLLSVFNKEALCFSSSHAQMDFRFDHGLFRHIGDEWPLPAKLYTNKEICHMAMKYFDLLERYSYPTILSVVSENYQREILEKLKEIDKDYANRDIEAANGGLYHSLFLKKVYPEAVPQCYLEIKKYISENEIVLQTIQHEEITSRAKMLRELNKYGVIAGDNFIKTVVLVDEENDMLIYFLLPLNKKYRKECLKTWYEQEKIKLIKRKLRFCTESELQSMGLTTGSVSPFSYPVIKGSKKKYLICDMEIQYSRFQTLYTYSGDLEITYKIGKSDFMTYLRRNNVIFTRE